MNLKKTADAIRKIIIEISYKSQNTHIGSMLSCVDILTALYFYKMRLNDWETRDIFIMSKAHAELALYVTLSEKGIIEKTLLKKFNKNDGTLPGHLDRFSAKGVECSSGSLGHGFNMGLGIAHSFKLQKNNRKVYVLIGDGEMQEGSIWEGAMFAPKLGLDNFTAILDYNNQQGYGRANEICEFEPVAQKWKAFGWDVEEIDGHSIDELKSSLDKNSKKKPRIIIAHTIKGKGVGFMEDSLLWHYYLLTDSLKKEAIKNLEKTAESIK